MASTVWKGHLSFGLISVPIKLTSAARRDSVGFNMLHKADKSRLKQVLMCSLEDKPVPRSEIVKGFEYAKDQYVEMDDAEIKSVEPKSAKTVAVVEFVKAQEVNALFLDSSYYVAPGAAAGERAYSLLYKALLTSGYVGVAKITMNGREHVVIVRPGKHGLLMHTMYFADEIRQVEEFRTDTTAVKADELAMAVKLMESMSAAFEPSKYKDEYRENVMALINAKVQGKSVGDAKAEQPVRLAPVVDIMTALKRSLARDDGNSTGGSVTSRVNASGKPHTNARRDTRGRFTHIGRNGGANGRAVGQRRAMGDPLSTDGLRGSAPQGSPRPAVGTPKRSISADRTGA